MSYLEDTELALTTGGVTTPIYIGYMPESPDECITLLPIRSAQFNAAMCGDTSEFRVQVWYRGTKYSFAAGVTALTSVYNILHRNTHSGRTYFSEMTAPISMGIDDNDRSMLVLDFRIISA